MFILIVDMDLNVTSLHVLSFMKKKRVHLKNKISTKAKECKCVVMIPNVINSRASMPTRPNQASLRIGS